MDRQSSTSPRPAAAKAWRGAALVGILALGAPPACQLVFPYGPPSACPGVDVSTDPHDCGSCGHDCQGGACVAGACAPVALASGLVQPEHIRIDVGAVYWTTNGAGALTGVSAVALDGGAPRLLWSGVYTSDLVVDSTRLWWGAPASMQLMTSYLDGGSAAPFAASTSPALLTSDDAQIYWYDFSGQHYLWAMSKDAPPDGGGTELYQVSSGSVSGMAVYQGNLYWTEREGGAVRTSPVTGGGVTTLATGRVSPFGIAVDASGIYWVDGGDAAASNGELTVLPLGGGTPRTLASALPHPSSVWLDATYVHWTNWGTPPDYQDGAVMRASKTGDPAVTVLASGQHAPSSLVGDAHALYWANSALVDGQAYSTDGTVMKLAR